MFIKNNKGITIIALIIIVLLMVLLASVTAYEANDLISITKKQSIETNLLLIQAKVRIINEQVVFEKDEEKKKELLVGTKLSDKTQVLNSLKEKKVLSSNESGEDYYVLSKKNLDDMGLDTLEENDAYVVNYNTEEVIYVHGVKMDDGVYLYKLSEMNVEV